LPYKLVNAGKRRLLYGAGHGFERLTAIGWRPQHFDAAFVAVGFALEPGESGRELSATVPEHFRAGRYRLTTDVTLLQDDGSPVRDGNGWPLNYRISQRFKVS
jgi:hypothetical protein